MPIVDAHPHIYSPDRDSYPTIEEPWEPGEPASAEDLKKKMDAIGVDRAVFIQTSTFYGHDNRYIMDSAKEHAEWACGVVTLDPDDKSHVDLLEEAVSGSNIRGMRGTSDSLDRIATPNVYRLWTKAMELGIPVNCMVMDDLERVPEIERIAQDLGDLKIVIDHCFMLNTRQKTEETLVALERLAKLPNVYAKLTSGTHGSYRVYPYPDMHDPLKRVIEAFTPSRCIWGSNFPNALWSKGATYAQNLHLFVKELGLSLPDKADILGMTAMSLWFPDEHEQEERAVVEQRQRTERESIEAQEADEPDAEVAEPEEAKTHRTQITQMADLIAAQGVVEGPIVDEVEGVELQAILDSANELNAVLDTLDFPANPVTENPEPDSSPEPALEFTHEDDEPAADVTVNVEELMASQNYTPIKTDEIGEVDDADSDVASDVQAQLDAALSSVSETPELGDEDLGEELETEDEITVNVEELLAAQEAESSDDVDQLEEDDGDDIPANLQAELDAALSSMNEGARPVTEDEDEVAVDVEALLTAQDGESTDSADLPELDVAADVQTQLDAALGSLSEPAEAGDEEEAEVTVNVEELLASHDDTSLEAEADEVGQVESESDDQDDGDLDISSILAAADELNAALETKSEAEPAVSVAESPGDVTVNVDELLAAQDYTPIKTDEIGQIGPVNSPGASSDASASDDDGFDVDAMMDVANQLNSMLESVEGIASNINDLAADVEDVDDQSERPSA